MALFDMMETTSAPVETASQQEWPKEKRLDDEKFLTGAYFTGNPLDSMRGIIDAPKFVPIGTLPDLTAEEIRGSRDMAGMLRAVTIKVSKSGQKFAIITVEDFTGSTEALLWGDSYTKAVAVEGLLQAGSFVKFRARISEDEKTGGKKVSANGLELLNANAPRRGKAKEPTFYEIVLNTARHTMADLQHIKGILLEHSGRTPVHITFRNSLGNRASIELGERYRVTPSPRLNEQLSLYS
jgi:DNA polymerase-3 subunit alpha